MKKIIFSISLWLAAAAAFAATQARDDEDKPPLVFRLGDMAQMQDHSDIKQDYYVPEPDGTLLFDSSNDDQPWAYSDHAWVAGVGGEGLVYNGDTEDSWDDFGNEYVDRDHAFDWPYTLDWTGGGGGDETYYYDGAADATNYNSMNILPDIGDESCAVKEGYPPPADSSFGEDGFWVQRQATETYQRAAQTMFCVQTGGKAMPLRQNLWQFTGWAAQVLNLRAQPPFAGTATQAIPPTQVALGGLGNLKADGTLWLKLPDGIEADVTPTVPGLNFYNFNVDGSKYPLYIDLSTSTTNANLETNTPEVCVGQTVTLGADWEGGIPPYTNVDSVRWNLPDKYVNQQTNYSATCTTYVKNQDLLTNLVQQCWYVNLPGGACSVSETLHFANGQAVNIAAAGGFTVYRPNAVMSRQAIDGTPTNIWISPWTTFCEATIGLGTPGNNDMCYEVQVLSPDFSGEAKITQLITEDDSGLPSLDPYLPYFEGVTYLDNSDPYPDTDTSISTNSISPFNGSLLNIIRLADAPSVSYGPLIHMDHSYTDYVMFAPNGGIYVTLGKVTWSTTALASCGSADFSTNSVVGPEGPDNSDDFPLWSGIFSNPNY